MVYTGCLPVARWCKLDEFKKMNKTFAAVAISNGAAVGFEAALYEQCAAVLFVSCVPVLSQVRSSRKDQIM